MEVHGQSPNDHASKSGHAVSHALGWIHQHSVQGEQDAARWTRLETEQDAARSTHPRRLASSKSGREVSLLPTGFIGLGPDRAGMEIRRRVTGASIASVTIARASKPLQSALTGIRTRPRASWKCCALEITHDVPNASIRGRAQSARAHSLSWRPRDVARLPAADLNEQRHAVSLGGRER
jgi:hypothetical protein